MAVEQFLNTTTSLEFNMKYIVFNIITILAAETNNYDYDIKNSFISSLSITQ